MSLLQLFPPECFDAWFVYQFVRVLGIDLGTTNSTIAEIIFNPETPDDAQCTCRHIHSYCNYSSQKLKREEALLKSHNCQTLLKPLNEAKIAENITTLVLELSTPELRYGPDTDIKFSALQELEIRFCAYGILECQKLDALPWDHAWSGVFPDEPAPQEINGMIDILTADSFKRLKTGYGTEGCQTIEEHLRMIWLEDCVTLDPYIRRDNIGCT